jgi:2'-5' RNA ligase
MPAKFRAFLAIDITNEVRYEITKLIKYLTQQNLHANIKWIKPENLHLTIRFLGNITIAQYEEIITQVSIATTNIKPFSINYSDLIIFPSTEKPVAIALKPEPIAPLIKLNRLIENSMKICAIKPDSRPYLPHLTLGKIKNKPQNLKLPSIELPTMQFTAQHVELVRSDTGGENSPQYTTLVCIPC